MTKQTTQYLFYLYFITGRVNWQQQKQLSTQHKFVAFTPLQTQRKPLALCMKDEKENRSHSVKLTKRGAYLNKMTGGATRGGVHRNRKKELSRNFCRKS